MSLYKLKGIPASPGIAIGRAYIPNFGVKFKLPPKNISEDEVDKELKLFQEALKETEKYIFDVKSHAQQKLGEDYAEIFATHLMVLEDPLFRKSVEEGIIKERLPAHVALSKTLHQWIELFSSIPNRYHRERMLDIYDIGKQIILFLTGNMSTTLWEDIPQNSIIIAHSLSPSDTIRLPKEKVLGFATDIGGKTSHTAIIAKALELPAVVGLREISYKVRENDLIILDGCWGDVLIEPSEEEISNYKKSKQDFVNLREKLSKLSDLAGSTKDGFRIPIRGNLESSSEIDILKKEGAEGIGLYRTEFLFLNRLDLPSEEEQYIAYKEVVEKFAPYPVTIRTLDLGGDKFFSYTSLPAGMSPLLGLRAIRLCLKNKELFLTQLKAILRASIFGNVKIMLPLITKREEIEETKALIEEAKLQLSQRNIEFDNNIKIGVMIETPAAALTVDILATTVDFFSLGTNDLIQYTFAIDRSDETTANIAEPYHPSIIRLIKQVIYSAHNYNKEVSICGELAGEPGFAVLLVGLGLDELSMSGISIMRVKEAIRRVTLEEAHNIAKAALLSNNSEEIKELLSKYE